VFLAAVFGIGGFDLLVPESAHGSEPDGYGWWNRLNSGATEPVAAPPPDVPSDGLYVAGDATGPQAIAAVAYSVPADEAPTRLTLTVTGSGARGTLAACVVPAGHVIPAQNGRWSDAPDYDAERCVESTAEDAEVTFVVSSLTAGDTLALAIVPTGPMDRAVFEAPGPDSLSTSPSGPSTPAVESSPVAPYAAATQPGDQSDPAAATYAAPSLAASSAPPAGSEPAAAVTPSDEPVAAEQRPLRAVSGPASPDWYGTLGAAIGGVLLFGVLLFYSLGYGPLGARYDR